MYFLSALIVTNLTPMIDISNLFIQSFADTVYRTSKQSIIVGNNHDFQAKYISVLLGFNAIT